MKIVFCERKDCMFWGFGRCSRAFVEFRLISRAIDYGAGLPVLCRSYRALKRGFPVELEVDQDGEYLGKLNVPVEVKG